MYFYWYLSGISNAHIIIRWRKEELKTTTAYLSVCNEQHNFSKTNMFFQQRIIRRGYKSSRHHSLIAFSLLCFVLFYFLGWQLLSFQNCNNSWNFAIICFFFCFHRRLRGYLSWRFAEKSSQFLLITKFQAAIVISRVSVSNRAKVK